MSRNNYWNSREIKTRERLLNRSIDSLMLQLKKTYKQTSDTIMQRLLALYDEIMAKGQGNVLVSHLYQYDRYYQLLSQLQDEMQRLGISENELMTNGLTQLYDSNVQLVGQQLGVNVDFSVLNAGNAIMQTWCSDGKDFSSRIWGDKRLLMENLEQLLVDCVAGGFTRDYFARQIRERMNVSFYCADRIARTEMSHVYNQSALDTYAHAGVSKYRILAEVDSRCCDECRQLNGKIYPISQSILPIHPNCRCATLAVLEE